MVIPGKDVIQVCESRTCGPRYSRAIMAELEKHFGLAANSENEKARLEFRGCLGYCSQANNIAVNGNVLSNVLPAEAVARVDSARLLPPSDGTAPEIQKEINRILEEDFLA